tara:strand:+ start:4669 stop:5364 length:696 start_codon:yes stop_codon:yes gene_type:complete
MIERGKAQDVFLSIERSGSAASISSATYSLYDQDGATVKDAVSCTVDGGSVTATIGASDTSGKAYARNWLIQFDVTISGKVYRFYNDAVLCQARLYSPVGQSDLIARHSDVVNLVATSKANLQDYIDTAFSDITGQMYSDAVPFWRFRTPSALRGPMFARCFELIFRDYSTLFDAGDRYSALSDRYAEQYDREMERLRSKIDKDEDNILDGNSVPATATIHLSSGPRRRWL